MGLVLQKWQSVVTERPVIIGTTFWETLEKAEWIISVLKSITKMPRCCMWVGDHDMDEGLERGAQIYWNCQKNKIQTNQQKSCWKNYVQSPDKLCTTSWQYQRNSD